MEKENIPTKGNTSTKLLSITEFNNIPISEITNLLKSQCSITMPKGASEINIRDLARNKLHGTHFIHNNEEKKGNIIIQKPIIIKKTYEKCPHCSQNKLILQPFPKSSDLYKSKWCENCNKIVKPGAN